jgi:tRNA A-37 threonylcarbamoyl transferase component Bud32
VHGEWVVPGYQHTAMLGEGASGRVVQAQHLETGTAVAIKYLAPRLLGDEEFLNRFRSEAWLLADLRDPNLVRLYEYVESTRGAAIVMELVNGVSLATLLRAEGPTEPEAALVVLKGSLLGLAAAHAVGVVHRDYKPGNVLVAGDGSSKLADFGVAVPAGQYVPAFGTPAYMAPEQWSGVPVGPATDVYAATAVFYECLTGERPYAAETIPQLALAHRSAPIPADRVPEPLGDLVERGMAKDPRQRPASAREFLGELESVAVGVYGAEWERHGLERLKERAALLALLFPPDRQADAAGTAVGHTQLGSARSAGRPGGRRKLGVAAAAAGVLLLVGGAAVVVAGQSGPNTPVAVATTPPSGGTGADPSSGPSLPPAVSPTATSSPGSGGGEDSPAPAGPTRTAVSNPFRVTGVNVSVARPINSRTGSFTVTVSTRGRPAEPVNVTINRSRGLESDSPGAITLSSPSYSATYSLTSGCGPADTGWNWTVTASVDGRSDTGSTSGPYWPRDKICG